MKIRTLLFGISSLFATSMVTLQSCGSPDKPDPIDDTTTQAPEIPTLEYTVKNTLPHDIHSFTEGFLVHNGTMYESSGAPDYMEEARSIFGTVDMLTGKINVKGELDKSIYFGEGISIFKGRIYQLTYQNRKGFIYDEKTYKKIGEFSYANPEGWGMSHDDTFLLMSDGSSTITYLQPDSLKPVRRLYVTEKDIALHKLNELEFINGYIYANVWMTNNIVKIDPKNGKVVAKLDLTSLTNEAKAKYPQAQEMNGIAFDKAKDRIYVTGKMWPNIYEIAFPH